MEKIVHKSGERGYANHGWLEAKHSFSFANYYNPARTHFGKLRVLNDDIIQPSKGFGLHPHEDMEIITIPLSGSLKHADNMGHESIITSGEVQVMSAGTGVWHSEHNASNQKIINLLQLWVFPNKKGLEPRYDQKDFNASRNFGEWQLIVSPDGRNDSLWINQDAYFSIIEFEKQNVEYELFNKDNGIYFFLIDGVVSIDDAGLEPRDAIGVSEVSKPIIISSKEKSFLLALELPMN